MTYSTRINYTRSQVIPDEIKLARFAKTPELGPKILFFSGGTALTQTSKTLTNYTHNSIHIITPFDSGGSSATLREHFKMPAIGDLRARIMAIADRSLTGTPEVIQLFSYRFALDKSNSDLNDILLNMAEGKHPLVKALPYPIHKIIRSYLLNFYNGMPKDFPLQGASIGNLILTSGYLAFEQQLDSVVYVFSQLVNAKGVVRPVVDACAHLCVELEDKQIIYNQNNFTGKMQSPITSPIKQIFLTDPITKMPIDLPASQNVIELIKQADLICYPIGSFFSSLLANLLPKHVGEAIAQNPCPKIFIPSTGIDPELLGYTRETQTNILLKYLQKTTSIPVDNIDYSKIPSYLNYILLDITNDGFEFEDERLNSSIKTLFYPLIPKETSPYISEHALCDVLLSLC